MNAQERATQVYWRVSLAYRKRKEAPTMNTSQALNSLREHVEGMHGNHSLTHKMADLYNQIVEGKPTTKASGVK